MCKSIQSLKANIIVYCFLLFISFNAYALFTFTSHDTAGQLLNFSNPVLIVGTGTSNGAGTASAGASYYYTNVITVDGVQVDAIVNIDQIVNATLNMFDDPHPNPVASDSTRSVTNGTTVSYITSFGAVVPEGAIFAPQITSINRTQNSYVQFTIKFQDTKGNPVVLKNVYNNTLDVESVEYNEFGGFQSYQFSSDYQTNTLQHMVATPGMNGNIRFSNSFCTGNPGLFITDASRVQTKFDTITQITIVNGQFANNAVPDGNGNLVSCTNITTRYYGTLFVVDDFTQTGSPPVQWTAPTVNTLITPITTPTVTGTIGGMVSTANANGSAMTTGDTFSVTVNGVTYTYPNANLQISGTQWALTIPTALAVGTYEVTATRNGILVDQTKNELEVIISCTSPQVANATGTACISPPPSTDIICHTGDTGDMNNDGVENALDDAVRHYTKILSNMQAVTGHETHPHDHSADANGKCPDDPVVCVLPQLRNATTNQCYTPLTCALPSILNATATACIISSVPTVTSQVSATTTPTVTGTIGNLALAGNETFAVTLNGTTYSLGNPNLTISGLNWSLNVTSALTRGTVYSIAAVRDGTLTDATNNELTILSLPTVIAQTTTNLTPTVTGTVGNATLGSSETFTVTVNNVVYSKGDGKLSVSGANWTLAIPSANALKISNTYDVIATRAGTLTDATTGELVITAITCTAPQVVNTTTNTCVTQQTSCTMVFDPLVTIPTGSDYDGQKVSICHFPPGNPNNVNIISVSVNALSAHLSHHGDSIWENGKVCPITDTDCDVNPDVDSKNDYDSCETTVTGHAGTNRSLTINIYDSTNTLRSTGTATITGSTNTNSWSYKLTTLLSAGKYNVETVGETGLKDATTNELTINKSTVPTVNTTTSTDQIKPTLTGSVGTNTSLTVSIVNSVGTTVTSGSATISGTTWTFTPSVLIPAGTYDVVVTGDATHCGLTDTTTNELTITAASYPTVNTTTTNDKTPPNLSGTTGVSTSLTISIVDASNIVQASGNATITGTNWTYVPSVAIPAGVYNVIAKGDASHGSLVDQTTNELTVTASTIPTVNTVTTTDKVAATLSGTAGTSQSLQIKVLDSSKAIKNSGTAMITGSTWTYKTSVLPVGTYDVVAQGDAASGSLTDNTTDELTVTTSVVPTVNTVTTNDKIAPTLTGTVGTSKSLTISIVDSKGSKIVSHSATITGTAWTYTPSAPIPAGVYDVVAKGDSASGSLVDTTKNELTVVATVPPTVNILTTNDITPPALTGTVGSSQSLTISIKNSTNVTLASGAATISGTTWNYTPSSPIAAGTYDVVALGDSTSGSLKDSTTNELTVIGCKLPLVYSASGTSCINPIPTVVKQTIESLTPVSPTITGTVGVVPLMSNETFTITVAGKIYDRTNSAVSFSDVNWTLTVPATSPISFGFYDVVAARNTTSKDKTTNELIINKQCLPPLLPDGTGRGCLAASAFPTVDVLTTDDTTPTVTGGVGDTVLATAEMFSVTVNGITYDRSSTQLSFNGTLWSLNIPLTNALTPGVYDVMAIRGDVSVEGAAIMDRTTNELTITPCNAPKQIDPATGDCANGNPIPTVDSLTTDKTQPTLTGTVGTSSLGNSETFTVSVNGQTYDKTTIIISGLTWSVTVTTDIQSGTYDVVALRAGQYKDQTTNELTITGDITICDNGTTKTIAKAMWDSSKLGANYYLGACNAPTCSTPPAPTDPANCGTPLPDPTKDDVKCQDPTITATQIAALNCVLPVKPSGLPDETVSIYTDPNGVNYCVSSTITTGVDNSSSITKSVVTIKKARIANSTTNGGQVCLYNSSTCPNNQPSPVIKYGTLSVSGNVDISGATVNKNVATGVNITNATLTGAYIDTNIDYINADGSQNPAGGYIPVYGGTTLKTPSNNVTLTNKAIVTSGVIVSGTDPQGNPIRGEITNATYDTDVINAANVLTKGRRVQGSVSNAKIVNARLTTVAGVSVLDQGTIVSGDMQSDASTYGSVINTTVQATTILMSSSQCSSAGNITGVGSRGQLMWKEIIKKK